VAASFLLALATIRIEGSRDARCEFASRAGSW
jgi:hypothetical protein